MGLLNHLDLTHQVRDLYQLFHDFLDVFIDVDDLGNYPVDDLDGGGREDHLGLFFVFVYLGNFLDDRHQFFNKVGHLLDLVYGGTDGHDLLLKTLHLHDLLLNVGLSNLPELHPLLNDHLFLHLRDDPRLHHHPLLLNNFLYHLRDRLHLHRLGVDVHWKGSFDVDGDRDFNGPEDDPIHKLYISLLDRNRHDLVHVDSHRNLLPLNDHSLLYHLLHLDARAGLKVLHQDLVARDLYCPIDIEIDDALCVDLYWFFNEEILRDVVLDRGHLDGYLNNFLNNFFDDLRHQHDLLDDPRHNHNLLHNFLYLHASRHFHDLLYDLFFGGRNLLDALHVNFMRDDLLLSHQDRHLFLHDERNILDHLDRFLLSQDDMFDDLDRYMLLHLYRLHEGDLVYLRFDPGLRDNNRHLYVLLHLSYLHPRLVDDLRDFNLHNLYLLHDAKHLTDDLYLLRRQLYHLLHSHYLLHDLRNGHDHLLGVIHRHYLFLDLFDNLYPGLYVRHELLHLLVAHHLHDLFLDDRDGHDLLPLYHLLHDFLYDHFDGLGHLLLCLHVANHLLDDLDRLYLSLDDDLLHLDHHCLLHLDDPLDLNFLSLQFGLLSHLNGHPLVLLWMRYHLFGVRDQLDCFLAVERDWLVGLHYQGLFVNSYLRLLQRHHFRL